jgi:protein-S-isoprenylcysteine O-methyltransferase Ste14
VPPLPPFLRRRSGLCSSSSGLLVVFWSARELAVRGRGTPNPLDPPLELVTTGPYQYVRNPMALGFVTLILGEAALYGSTALLVWIPRAGSR